MLEAPEGSLDTHPTRGKLVDRRGINQCMFSGATPSVFKQHHVWGGCQGRRATINELAYALHGI